MLSKVLERIERKYEHDDSKIKYFSEILNEFYKNREFNNECESSLEYVGLYKKHDLLLYGKNYPLFKSILYFNEVPLFKSETQAIVFLKKNGFNPSKTYFDLKDSERIELGNKLMYLILKKVPNEFIDYVPKLVFGDCYYLKKYNIELEEYVSKLNALSKINEHGEIEKSIVYQKLPDEDLVKKYRMDLAKSINLFNKMLEDKEINHTTIEYNNKKFTCQYIYIKQSIWDRIKGWVFGSIKAEHYPALVNIAYSNPKIDYLKPFFILNEDGYRINVFARVPKLLYFKYNLTLNHMNLTGKHTYFGSWSNELMYEFLGKG